MSPLVAVPDLSEPESATAKAARALRLLADAVAEMGSDKPEPIKGLTFAQVAEMLNVTPGTVHKMEKAGLRVSRVTKTPGGRGCPLVLNSELESFLKKVT